MTKQEGKQIIKSKNGAICEIRTVKKGKKKRKVYVCTDYSKDTILCTTQTYLDIINGAELSHLDKEAITKMTVSNFSNFFNKGYITYRKSVAEADEYAALEWEGQGSIIKDIHGKQYLDFLGGYGIYNCGIKHPKIVRAALNQLKRMPLSSQELLDPLRAALAQVLGQLTPGDLQECFFISNGTDAVEGALKLARLYTKKDGFISTLGGFHGKSMGSLSLMGKSVYRKPFEPLLGNVHFVPFGNAQALEQELEKHAALGTKIAAFICEPIQGEAGAIVPPDDYLPKVRKLCTKYKILLILDEVQTGMGRTGKMFACQHWNVVPDILCLGKSLGGGVMPLSCFMGPKRIWKVMEPHPFLHTSTFGGNPLACAAGLAAINVLLSEDLPKQAEEKGDYILAELKKLERDFPLLIKSVHGKGLLIGIDFTTNEIGYAVAAGLFHRGILVAGTLISSQTIRIEPALNVPWKFIDIMLAKLKETLRGLKVKS